MTRMTVLLAAIAFVAICPVVYAAWSVSDQGAWPKSWPQELEPLRKQSGTIQGGLIDRVIHHIPFTTREEFEAAWPHLVKVKSKGAPIILVRSPSEHWHFGRTAAGVFVYTPDNHDINADETAKPLPGQSDPRVTWMKTRFIELVVDGEIVDLNRIPLPADTPIIDERFERSDDNTGR